VPNIVYIIAVCLFSGNIYLSQSDPIGTYEEEITLYKYVEVNGIALLPFAISIAALIYALNIKFDNKDKNIFFYNILVSVVCFVCISMILWIPKGSAKGIRYLRAAKTVLLLIGGFFIIFSLLHIKKKI
jgi:hypothetical protein